MGGGAAGAHVDREHQRHLIVPPGVAGGGQASEGLTDRIYEYSRQITRYRTFEGVYVDLERRGLQTVGGMEVEVVVCGDAYARLLESRFDFDRIREWVKRGQDAPSAVDRSITDPDLVSAFGSHGSAAEEGGAAMFNACEWGQIRRTYDSTRKGPIAGKRPAMVYQGIYVRADSPLNTRHVTGFTRYPGKQESLSLKV